MPMACANISVGKAKLRGFGDGPGAIGWLEIGPRRILARILQPRFSIRHLSHHRRDGPEAITWAS